MDKSDRRYKKQQDEVFCKVFYSMQLCWWYTLYAPEYGDWSSEQAKEFTCKMNSINDRLEKIAKEDKEKLITDFVKESEIDHVKIASDIPYAVKMKMYGKALPMQNEGLKIAFPFQMNCAAREMMFLAIYTLYTEYKKDKNEIKKYIDCFMEFSKEYQKGLKDRHIIKYFAEIEQIPILN